MRIASAFDWLKYSTVEAEDPYKLLGISCWANNEMVKRAWHKAMMNNHPDRGGSTEKTVGINEAYHVIRQRRGI